MKMEHTSDPSAEILTALAGAHDGFSVVGSDILMAIYQRPEKTAGGIILTDNVKGEDIYQGKIGLVLKVGPLVHETNEALYKWFNGKLPKPGDWAVVRVGDTYAFNLAKVPCRTLEAKQIRGLITEPDSVW